MIARGVPALTSWENEGGRVRPARPDDARLAWADFRARFYPEARRHDYPSIVAYHAYLAVAPAHAA